MDWMLAVDDPAHRAWSGYAFEMVCLAHIDQIKKALGISGVQTHAVAWSGNADEKGCQIDLLIDRRDDVVNVCEVKFSKAAYLVSKKYGEEILQKIEIFREATKTPKAIFLTFITCFGLKNGNFKDAFVQNDLTMDALFSPLS